MPNIKYETETLLALAKVDVPRDQCLYKSENVLCNFSMLSLEVGAGRVLICSAHLKLLLRFLADTLKNMGI